MSVLDKYKVINKTESRFCLGAAKGYPYVTRHGFTTIGLQLSAKIAVMTLVYSARHILRCNVNAIIKDYWKYTEDCRLHFADLGLVATSVEITGGAGVASVSHCNA